MQILHGRSFLFSSPSIALKYGFVAPGSCPRSLSPVLSAVIMFNIVFFCTYRFSVGSLLSAGAGGRVNKITYINGAVTRHGARSVHQLPSENVRPCFVIKNEQ